jgi:hypothetical protein
MSDGVPGYEKIGAFYLGREQSREEERGAEPLVLYDSKDLVTHAVCVGMTGSGKGRSHQSSPDLSGAAPGGFPTLGQR